jgi:hypothetical protein
MFVSSSAPTYHVSFTRLKYKICYWILNKLHYFTTVFFKETPGEERALSLDIMTNDTTSIIKESHFYKE